MAMFPVLMNDDEFKENFDTYYDQFLAGFPDTTLTNESMGILCDNAYRRIKDETCTAHIKTNIDKAGNMMRVAQAQIDSGAFTPTSVLAGEFTIFANTGPATKQALLLNSVILWDSMNLISVPFHQRSSR